MGVYYIGSIPCSGGDIYHFGRKGQKWGKHIFGDIAEFITGRKARANLKNARSSYDSHVNAYDPHIEKNRSYQKNYINIAKQYKYTGIGNKHTPEIMNFAKNWMVQDTRKINKEREERKKALDDAQAEYDKTLPGMMAKAREKVSKAYSDAASALSGKGLDIQSFYSQVMEKAKGAINAGKNMVSKYGGQFVDQIKTMGENALKGGKKFLEGIMFKVKRSAAYAGHYINAEKNKKNKKNREAPPGSLVWDNESLSWKPNDDTFVDKNHPEAEQHRKYIDDHGRVATTETNTVVGHKKRMKDPGHLDPTQEKAFARERKHWHQPYRTDKRLKEAERDRKMAADDARMIEYYAKNDPEYLPTYLDHVVAPNARSRQERERKRERERSNERRW